MSGIDWLDPFVIFCGVEVLAVFALVVILFGRGLNCVYIALSLHGYVTPAMVDLLFAPERGSETAAAEAETEAVTETTPETEALQYVDAE